MNIFLLFLTTILMIGYYLIYSPSQNLENMDTNNVIQLSDLRSKAECVVAAQNSAMESIIYDDPCVELYGIVSQYICTNGTYSLMPCDGNTKPTFNYIITTSDPVADKDRTDMLTIIGSLYQDKGSFGIYQKPFLITPDAEGQREIAGSIADQAKLENGQLVYIMQYQIPHVYTYPETPDENGCTDGTIRVQRYGRWLCIGKDPVFSCPDTYRYDQSVRACVPYGQNTCDEACEKANCGPDETCVCYDSGRVGCKASTTLECPEGYEPVFNPDPTVDGITCIPSNPEEGSPCSDVAQTYRNAKSTPGRTIRVKTVHCGTCLKVTKVCNKQIGQYEYICLPDPDKITSKSCFDGILENCTAENNRGIYFGFSSFSRTDGIKTNNGEDLNIEQALDCIEEEKSDNMFHCKKCNNGINEEISVSPYVICCN